MLQFLSTSLVRINGIIKSVNTLEEILLNQQMKLSTLGTQPDKFKTKALKIMLTLLESPRTVLLMCSF